MIRTMPIACFLALTIVFHCTSASAQGVYLLVDDGVGGTGGDCAAVGVWDGTSSTCTLIVDVGGTVQIASAGMTLDCSDPITDIAHRITGPGGPPPFGVFALPPGANDLVIRNCDISGHVVGFLASGTSGHRIEHTDIHDNTYGIYTNGAHGSDFVSNRVEDNEIGMWLNFSDDVSITNNTFLRNQNDRAIRLWGGQANLIAENVFTENGFGLTMVGGSGGNEVRDNLFIDNGVARTLPAGRSPTVALGGEGSNENTLTNNVMVGNAYGFGLKGTGNSVDTSNTVNGRPIYWFNNLTGATITPATAPNAAGVYCDRCTGVTIRDFVLTTPMGVGIGLYGTTASTVADNVIRDASFGIFLPFGSDDNAVLDNDVRLGFEDVFAYGIRLNGSDGNTIAGNIVDLGPGNSGWIGISLGRHFGVTLDPADRNTVTDNTVTRVLQEAIEVAGSDNIVEGNTMNDTGGGIFVGGVLVDKHDNIIRQNVIFDGRDAWFPFDPAPGTFGHGITVSEAVNTLVTRNIVTGMRDMGLLIEGSIGTQVFRNNIYDNAPTGFDNAGDPIFEVSSRDDATARNPVPIELSVGGIGNYWGRHCGIGTANGPPLFQPGIDSNDATVVDSYPFVHPVVAIPSDVPLSPPALCPSE